MRIFFSFILSPNGGQRRGFSRCLLLGWFVSLAASGAVCFAQEPQSAEVGLRGILGEELPRELDTEFLASNLPESWTMWAEELDEENQEFHFDELDVAGQREIIAKLRRRVDVMEQAIADRQYAPIWDVLISLSGPLKRRLDLAEAVLDTLESDVAPVSQETRTATLSQLRQATRDLNAWLTQTPGGEGWKTYLELPQLLERLEDPRPSAEALEQRISAIAERIDDAENLTADQLRFLRGDRFWPFRRAIVQMQTLLEWDEMPATQATLRDVLAELVRALEATEENNLTEDSIRLQLAMDKLRLINADTRPMFDVLGSRYFANNARMTVSENLMQEIIYDRRTEPGQIQETVMGARVYGNRVANTETTFDLLPSSEEALMAVRVRGDIQASTVGVVSHIKVYTQGSSQFWAVKAARFNGFRFQSYPAEIAVQANNLPYDAETMISCFPVLGPCLDNVVLNQALRRKDEADATARQRVADAALPELNREINNGLAEANQELSNNIYRRLANNNLYPVELRTSTTETLMRMRGLIRNRAELGGGPVPATFHQSTGANLIVHESLLNNVADRMDLAGRTMTEEEVRDEISRFLFELTGQEFDLSDPEQEEEEPAEGEMPEKFVFDKVTPFRFQIRDGQVRMTVRTGLIRANGDEIPPHDITVPLEFEVTPEEIAITKGTLVVNRADGQRGNFFQHGVMRKKIGDSIPDGSRSRDLQFEVQPDKTLDLRIERVQALDGWLSVWALPTQETSETRQTAPDQEVTAPSPKAVD